MELLLELLARRSQLPREAVLAVLQAVQQEGYQIVRLRTKADVHLPKLEK